MVLKFESLRLELYPNSLFIRVRLFSQVFVYFPIYWIVWTCRPTKVFKTMGSRCQCEARGHGIKIALWIHLAKSLFCEKGESSRNTYKICIVPENNALSECFWVSQEIGESYDSILFGWILNSVSI